MDDFEKQKEEQERKRELYRQQQKARIGNPLHKKPSVSGMKQNTEQVKEAMQIAGAAVAGPAGAAAAAGKIGAKKIVKSVMKGGVKGLTEMAGQQGSEYVLNILWASLLTPMFPLILFVLNVYALASSGILDMVWPDTSKNLAPFGLYTKILPFGLGQILGIIALIVLDFITFVIILIIITLIYFMIHPIEGFKVLFLG